MRARTLAISALAIAAARPAVAGEVRLNGVADPGAYRLAVVSWRDLPFRNVVRQQWDFSCGSAAAATLLRVHYGRQVDEATAFRAMWEKGDQPNIRKHGFSFLDIKHFIASQGLASDGYRLTLEQLQAKRAPALVLLRIGAYLHFVVVLGVRDERVLIADPALGRRILSAADFRKGWNGVAFLVHADTPPLDYDQDQDWMVVARAPLRASLPDQSTWAAYRALPPVYQVATIFPLR